METEDDPGSTCQDSRKCEKYSLRPRSGSCIKEGGTARGHKAKQKPPPLSKYRRKSANARERYRMLEMNQAFEALRRIIPNYPTVQMENKLTKVTTLRMAVSYIKALSQMLEEDDGGSAAKEAEVTRKGEHAPERAPRAVCNKEDAAGVCRDFVCSSEDILNAVMGVHSETFGDLFSEDGSNLGDNLCDTTFDDIPSIPMTDPCFDILLESDGESLVFSSDFSDYTPTP